MAKKIVIVVLVTPVYFFVFWFLLMMLQYVAVLALPERLLAPTLSAWPWLTGVAAACFAVRLMRFIWPQRHSSLS